MLTLYPPVWGRHGVDACDPERLPPVWGRQGVDAR